MARVSESDLERSIKNINDNIKQSGSKLILGQRYGYKAIDEGYSEPTTHGGIKRTLIARVRSGEVDTYLSGVSDGIRLARQKKIKEVV